MRQAGLTWKGSEPGSSSNWRISYAAASESSRRVISMNSGELPLKTRRKVSLAADGAGTGSAAPAAGEAAAINRNTRRREVFMVLCERKAVKVMRDRRAANAPIRCAATRHALSPLVELVFARRWNLLRRATRTVSL